MLLSGAEDVAAEIAPGALLPLAFLALSLGIPAAWYGLSRLRERPPAATEGTPATPVELALAVPILILSQLAVASLLTMIYGGVEGVPPLAGLFAVPVFLLPLVLIAFLRARGTGLPGQAHDPLGGEGPEREGDGRFVDTERKGPARDAAGGAVRQKGGWEALGIGLHDSGAISNALLVWLLFLPLLYGLVWASPSLYEALGLEWAPQAHGKGIASLEGWSLGLAALLAVVIIPFFEELIFRGWMQQGLVHLLGPRAGLLLPAALFTINHDPSVWLPILLLALLLGSLRERTQRLWPCVAVHVAHNGLQVMLLALGMHLQ